MPRTLCLAAALLALAACDSQAPPPRTNPFDPGFEGNAIATAPADLALAEATSTSATLSWTDRSSFETGIRVERLDRFGTYQPLVTLPPDATRYTDTGLTGTEPRTYRVVALAAGGTASAPSDPLRIRYPADTLDLGPLNPVAPQISPDGERLFTRDGNGTRITNLRTGASLGTIPRIPDIIGFLADGRLAFRENTPPPFTLGVRFFDGTVQQSLATLRFPENGCFGIGESTTVSADGRRVADICAGDVLMWTLPSDAPARFALSFATQSPGLVLSPDASRIFVQTRGSSVRLQVLDAATGALVWTAQNLNDASDGTTTSTAYALSADGSVLAYATDGRLRIVDPTSGAVRVEGTVGRLDGVLGVSPTEVLTRGYDETLQTTVSRVLRTSDLSLVRTLSGDTFSRARLVPGALVSVGQADGRTVAVRQSFTAVWEAAGR